MKKKYHATQGITLVEIMVAFVILAFGLFSLMMVFPQLFALEAHTENVFIATVGAEEKLDELTDSGKPVSTSPISDNPTSLRNCTRTWWGENMSSGEVSVQKTYVKITWFEKNTMKSLTVTGLVSSISSTP
ncbi:MAG: hypothetical protein AB9903_08395 [Vulcanimicrobiota bacterium]